MEEAENKAVVFSRGAFYSVRCSSLKKNLFKIDVPKHIICRINAQLVCELFQYYGQKEIQLL